MTTPTVDIERVVREVLAEMGSAGGKRSTEGRRWRTAEARPAEQRPSPRLSLAGDLCDQCAAWSRWPRWPGGSMACGDLVVSPQAIVTPAVRDELLRARHRLAAVRRPARTAGRATAVGVRRRPASDFDPAALVAGLAA